MPRITYTIPEPERSMFRALSEKTKTSEAELIRKFIRWACKLAGVVIETPTANPEIEIPEAHDSPADIQGDSASCVEAAS